MRFSTLIAILCLGSLAAGQTSFPQTPTPATPKTAVPEGQKPSQATPPEKEPSAKRQPAESKEVAPDVAVLTIKGLCSTATPKASAKTAGAAAASKPAA